ncbi:unnamed protein product [Allacma fusca]|uniref:Uncharacterized protein n=1 Tax=Allacma fusca TaxID=39272 RepID=A0A8J2KGL4_9HEXA|nr:unnamed protein product [Allacma fusca]
MRETQHTVSNKNTIRPEQWEILYRNHFDGEEDLKEKAPHMQGPPFTTEEVHIAIKCLANNKSPGTDGIPNEIWKNLPPELLPCLTV